MKILGWATTYCLERTSLAQELTQLLADGLHEYKEFLYENSRAQTPHRKGEKICISGTLDSSSYLEFIKNYRNPSK